jgi:hypothetical protein
LFIFLSLKSIEEKYEIVLKAGITRRQPVTGDWVRPGCLSLPVKEKPTVEASKIIRDEDYYLQIFFK